MSPYKVHPCEKGLTWDCFKEHPAWAKQAFAYRLLHTLFPGEITRRLPKGLWAPLIGPGVIIPPGAVMDPGTVVFSGTVYPAGWEMGYPWPPGVIIPPTLPPGYEPDGTTSPLYVRVWDAGPAHGPTPGGFTTIVEATITASNDGRFGGLDWQWATAHAMDPGNVIPAPETETDTAIEAKYDGMNYKIFRAFVSFDLSAIPAGAVVTACTFRAINYGTDVCDVTVQEGTQSTSLSEFDFQEFTGSYFDMATWIIGNNVFTLNTAGIAYIQGVIGATANLCMREYDHDYLDVAPGLGEDHKAGCYWSGAAANNRPRLSVTYAI